MSDPKREQPKAFPGKLSAPKDPEEIRAAVVTRLLQISRSPRPKSSECLQPTPEAAQSRTARLRRKQRVLIQKSKRLGGGANAASL
jgi:hypothetical protein